LDAINIHEGNPHGPTCPAPKHLRPGRHLPSTALPPDSDEFLIQGYTVIDPHTTAAGEDVRILDLPAAGRPRELTEIDHDFWLIDGERVVRMHYNADATFHGGELMPADTIPSYRAAREIVWNMAEEFTSWWAAHPEYHRAHHHVT
jgi:hypothetical protein